MGRVTSPREIVLGPPGTGKTTTLLSTVEEELARGTAPSEIGFVTFTRRGAEEAVTRACAKFGVERDRFPFFRTLHSLCYRWLGLKGGDVLEGKTLAAFADHAGVRITGRFSEDGLQTGFDQGDRLLFMENLSRIRCITLRRQYDLDDDGLSWSAVHHFSKALASYKKAHGLMDYTDMLSEFVAAAPRLKLKRLVVDEGQDLSELQWRVVDVLAQDCQRVSVAGDDDQAIYRWAGANVDRLIDMPGDVRVLGHSYRVPPAVQAVAGGIIAGVRRRREKQWSPREGVGSVDRMADFGDVDTDGESVLILARNTYLLRSQVEPILRRRGVIYEKSGHPSIKASILDAITAWEKLRAGGAVSLEQARDVYGYMSAGAGVQRGFKKKLQEMRDEEFPEGVTMQLLKNVGGLTVDDIWHEAMDRLPTEDMSYLLAALRRGERTRGRPRVRVSTIHGSKGGEADHVVLLREMARRTHLEMELNPDDERRVWYVAVTRAREKLTVVDTSTSRACPWL